MQRHVARAPASGMEPPRPAARLLHNPTWQRNAVQALVDLLPHAQRRSLEGQDHEVAPEVLAPVLVGFLVG
jgi:hypothetical protein